MPNPRTTAVALAFALAGTLDTFAGESHATPQEDQAGRICVATLPEHAAEIDREARRSKPRREYTYRFSVRLDSREWIEVPKERGVAIEDIPVGQNHALQIRDGDRLIESIPFTFEEKSGRDLCLRYTPWYQTWRLDPPSPRAWWCKCEDRAK